MSITTIRSFITDTSSLHSSLSSPVISAENNAPLPETKPPLILIPLLSASLGFSSIAFSLAVADTIPSAPFDTIPTLVAYLILFPSHIAAILVALHLLGVKASIGDIHPWLLARRTMVYILVLVGLWTLSTVACTMGAMRFREDISRYSTCIVAAALSALEVWVLGAIAVVGVMERKRMGMSILP